jgi:hypothetical protein
MVIRQWSSGDSLQNSLFYLLNCPQEHRQIVVDCIPNNLQIDSEVLMGQQVAEILDVLPGDMGIREFRGQFT